jgi:hypothetical protein
MKYGELHQLMKNARANNIALMDYRFNSSAGWLVEVKKGKLRGGCIGQFEPEHPNKWEWRFNFETIFQGEGIESLIHVMKQFD